MASRDDERYNQEKREQMKQTMQQVQQVSILNRATQYRRHIEPTVLSIELLRAITISQGPREGFARYIAEDDGIPFSRVTELRLDFCNIAKIQCLDVFVNLVKLNLDNNVIARIEALDKLTNLEWLDLSSNNLTQIDGLDNNTKLKCLCVSNNKIDKLDNMLHLKDLETFSIACNKIDDIRQLRRLYALKNLQSVTFTNNPVVKDRWYRWTLLAFIPSLKYLDYKQLALKNSSAERRLQVEKAKACDHFQHILDEFEQKEHFEAVEVQKAKQEDEKTKALEAACLTNFRDSDKLFSMMYDGDEEGRIINTIPGVEDLLNPFKLVLVPYGRRIHRTAIELKDRRHAELSSAEDVIKKASKMSETESVAIVEQFMAYKSDVIYRISVCCDDLQQTQQEQQMQQEQPHDMFQDPDADPDQQPVTDRNNKHAILDEFFEALDAIKTILTGAEIASVEQIEDILKDFEQRASELMKTYVERITETFSFIRDRENEYQEKLLEFALATFEKVVRKQIVESQITPELALFFMDKEAVTNSITQSHDHKTGVVDRLEDSILGELKNWYRNVVAEKWHAEFERNRDRMREILHLCDHCREEVLRVPTKSEREERQRRQKKKSQRVTNKMAGIDAAGGGVTGDGTAADEDGGGGGRFGAGGGDMSDVGFPFIFLAKPKEQQQQQNGGAGDAGANKWAKNPNASSKTITAGAAAFHAPDAAAAVLPPD